MVRGEVLETMDAAGYTYVLIGTDQEQRWVAGPKTSVDVGDIVQTAEGQLMTDFASGSLGRTFEAVYFVGVIGNLSNPTMPEGHPMPTSDDNEQTLDVAIAPLQDNQDIAWVFANKDTLAGQEVSLRGKVVKYNANILGRNFVHIRDGSGSASTGTNDLTLTTTAETAVGATVVVTGQLVLDKDFGYGYSFPVIVEDASITPE
jgi:hypothetical protein